MKLNPTDIALGACLTGALATTSYIFITHMRPGSKPPGAEPQISIIEATFSSEEILGVSLPRYGVKESIWTVAEFGDYQCPPCRFIEEKIKPLFAVHPEASYTFRNYPLRMHPNAKPSALAAIAASKQGKYWEMHDALYANQEDLTQVGIKKLACSLKLNINKFIPDMTLAAKTLKDDITFAYKAKLSFTPSFIVRSPEGVVALMDYAGLEKTLASHKIDTNAKKEEGNQNCKDGSANCK